MQPADSSDGKIYDVKILAMERDVGVVGCKSDLGVFSVEDE